MTRALLSAVLYVALALGANPVVAETPDRETLLALRNGDMRKLAIHESARDMPDLPVVGMDDKEHHLSELHGKYVLLNFWATWCAPCREEMPALNALQKEFGGEDFQVALIAVGRNPPPAIRKFFEQAGIDSLETWRDPKQKLAANSGVMGLPVTILLDPEGKEIARMQGDADWHSPDAIAFLRAVLGLEGA